MNGEPLPIDHGFPVRTIVPGLYGYVSACKWVVDMEVTRFEDFDGVLDRARLGRAGAGQDRLADRRAALRGRGARRRGRARRRRLAQHTGIDGVEVALDGGDWQPRSSARVPTDDTWVQWAARSRSRRATTWSGCGPPTATARCRPASSATCVPDGATGWHTIDFTARAT